MKILILISLLAATAPVLGADTERIADELVLTYEYTNILKGIDIYKKALESNPDDYELLWRLAKAYNAILDIKTYEAIITTEGLSDTKENKKLWRTYGEKALACSQRARQIMPEGVDGMLWHAISYAYYSSSFGIVKAIFSGAARKFKKNAELLIKHSPENMGGLGYRHLGIFYLAAPFPLGSSSKSARYMKKALHVNQQYLQNHYYHGLALYRLKKYDDAQEEFEFVVQNPPQPEEKHSITAFREEAKNFLMRIK